MKNKKEIFILAILIIIFSMAIAPKTFQNDTYFTIALGNNILENGINNKEVLTWHDNLEFTNVRWLFNVFIAIIYKLWGFFGIYAFVMIMSAIIGITLFWILTRKNINNILAFFLTICIMHFGQGILAARAQIISIWLFILEFYCIEKLLETNKKRYWVYLIVIPIAIANIHTSLFPIYFIFFLPYFAEFILAKLVVKTEDSKIIIEDRKNIKGLLIIFIISIFTGLCTPLGLSPYTVMVKASQGISTMIIAELQPLISVNQINFMVYIIIIFAILGFTKIKVKVTDLLLLLGLGLMSLSTIRGLFYFIFVGGIALSRMINQFIEENKLKIKSSKLITTSFLIIISVIILSISGDQLTNKLTDEYVDTSEYPVDACEYILTNLDIQNMRIYNGFNNGSYLEFKGIPAFMDSRSEIYCPEFNDTSILEDFSKISNGSVHYKQIFDKYDITHVLVKVSETINIFIQNDSKWNQIYQDDVFVLYERTNVSE